MDFFCDASKTPQAPRPPVKPPLLRAVKGPKKVRSDASKRAPVCSPSPKCWRAEAKIRAVSAPQGLAKRNVDLRTKISASFAEEKVDRRGPGSNPGRRHKPLQGVLVGECDKVVGLEIAADNRLGKGPGVANLGAGETDAAKVRVGQGENGLRRHGLERRRTPLPDGGGGGGGDLLTDEEFNKTRKSRLLTPPYEGRGQAVGAGQPRIQGAERTSSLVDVVLFHSAT